MRNLNLAEIKSVSGAIVSVTVRPGETNIMLTEAADKYAIKFYNSSSNIFTNCAWLTVQGNGTYSWGTNLWGTPYPDFFPTQVKVENGYVTFKVANA